MLKLDSRLCKTRDLPWKTIEKEAILVDAEEGEVLRFSGIGAEIWEHVGGNKTVEDIINHIYETFEAKKKCIEKDVFGFLKKLIRLEIIRPCN